MSTTKQLELSQIDMRLCLLRLTNPLELRRLQESIQSEGGIRDPVLVSTNVEAGHWVLVDGFKRLYLAKKLGLTHVWVQEAQLDVAHAKAAILQCNQPRQGLSKLEEAWIVHSLCREQGMMQTQVAELLKRDKSWVCRRMKLAEGLEESLQDEVRQGSLPAAIAWEVSRLQRCNQKPVAQAIRDHRFSSRESSQLVRRLRSARRPQEQAVREMLEDPWRYIAAAESATKHTGDSDPRLSEAGNRLRRRLLGWQDVCGLLTRELRRAYPGDVRVLAPLVQDAVVSGMQVLRQLEAIQSALSTPPPTTLSEQASVSATP